MSNYDETIRFKLPKLENVSAEQIILQVFRALQEKGYDPKNQMIGYFLSGDPTYITAHNDARTTICQLERDELMEELLRFYVENH